MIHYFARGWLGIVGLKVLVNLQDNSSNVDGNEDGGGK